MRLAILLPFVAVTACSQAPMSGQSLGDAQLEFTVAGSVQSSATLADTVAVLRVAQGEAVIEGYLSTPNPCYNVEATLEEEAGSLVLRVPATSQGGFCAQVLASFRYEARLRGLAPGSYSILVVHTYPQTGWEDRTYELRVDVP